VKIAPIVLGSNAYEHLRVGIQVSGRQASGHSEFSRRFWLALDDSCSNRRQILHTIRHRRFLDTWHL